MAEVRAAGNDRIEVAGDLLFGDAVAARDAGRALIAGMSVPEVTVSLAALGRVSSVSAVVLVEWQRCVAATGKQLKVVDVPPKLAGILRLSGLEELLPTG
ncbi:MAG: lipid asymmetry maintenance protein MlaB [Gammaproteobacteria bacterium]